MTARGGEAEPDTVRARIESDIPYVLEDVADLPLDFFKYIALPTLQVLKHEREPPPVRQHVRVAVFSPRGECGNVMTTRSNKLVPAPQESDGVLLATFLSWRLYSAEPPITICLEEPENGFYPGVLDERFKLLRSFAAPEDSSLARAQILVSTHSLEFLGVLKQHHSDFAIVRTVDYLDDQNETRMESLKGCKQTAQLIEHVRDGDSVLPSIWQKR